MSLQPANYYCCRNTKNQCHRSFSDRNTEETEGHRPRDLWQLWRWSDILPSEQPANQPMMMNAIYIVFSYTPVNWGQPTRLPQEGEDCAVKYNTGLFICIIRHHSSYSIARSKFTGKTNCINNYSQIRHHPSWEIYDDWNHLHYT